MIKSVSRFLKQRKERYRISKRVQDLIPISCIWEDGIFRNGSQYSKTFRFSDINHKVASDEDQRVKKRMRWGNDFRDYICPDSMEKHSNYLKIGDRYARVLFIKSSAAFFTSAWQQFRKRNAFPTAITQNVDYLLDSVQARTMLGNSERIVMLNQSAPDR